MASFIVGTAAGVPLFTDERYWEIWTFLSMPPDDTAIRQWFQSRNGGKPVVVITKKPLHLTVEYDRQRGAAAMRPDWAQFGYAEASLQASGRLSDGLLRVCLYWSGVIVMLIAGFLIARREPRLWACLKSTEVGPKHWLRLIFLIAGTTLTSGALYKIYAWILGRLHANVPEQNPLMGMTVDQMLWMMPVVVILGPIAEEVLFRGVMFSRFWREGHPITGVLFTSVLFGLLHGIPLLLPMFAIGLLLALLFWRTKTLIAPISVHVANNLIAFIATLHVASVLR
jgi:membrane protease YdiL (CAAX protease family)